MMCDDVDTEKLDLDIIKDSISFTFHFPLAILLSFYTCDQI